MSWFVQIMSILPKSALSMVFGWLVQLELPPPLNTWVCQGFAKLYGVDLSEAAEPIDTYKTLEDFFVRELKPGLRPVSGPYSSPADGTVVYSRATEQGSRAVQVKGVYYSLDELVLGKGVQGQDSWQWFTTVYLAPHNYHRVHAPVAGRLEQIRYIPGELWPVNETFVALVPQLFVTNERLVFDISLPLGGKVAVVMVGALNVGRMRTPYWPDFFTNDRLFGAFPKVYDLEHEPTMVDVGDELGVFMLGSTVVIAMDAKARNQLQPALAVSPRQVKMGELLTVAGGN